MSMRSRKYLVLFHAVTCGQNGAALGSDEQDIVLISYLVVDSLGNKVLLIHIQMYILDRDFIKDEHSLNILKM